MQAIGFSAPSKAEALAFTAPPEVRLRGALFGEKRGVQAENFMGPLEYLTGLC